MDEPNLSQTASRPTRGVYHHVTCALKRCERMINVGDLEGDVMQARPPRRYEAANSALVLPGGPRLAVPDVAANLTGIEVLKEL
jgi:hypothetical protein